MKVVTLRDAKQALAAMAEEARGETVLITRRGKPYVFLTSAAGYDWEDVQYMSDPAFWRMIEKARREPTTPIEEVRRRFGLPPSRRRTRKARRKRAV